MRKLDPGANRGPTRSRVDVVVLTWNTATITPRVLRELVDAEHGCDIRLFLRDNASSDGTARAVAAMVPEADVEAGTENIGFSAGVNRLLARTTAPWIFLLNPDAWPSPGSIDALVAAGGAHPDVAAVLPRIENPDGTLQHSTHPFPSARVAALAALGPRIVGRSLSDRLLLNGGWMHDRPRTVDWGIAAAWMIRREALEDIGGFDERFFMYAEDLEWCWRARKKGWRIWFEPNAVVSHLANASGSIAWGDRRTAVHARNAYRFYRGEHSLPSTLAWWGLTVAGPAIRALGARARGDRSRAYMWHDHALAHWRAARSGIEHLPRSPDP